MSSEVSSRMKYVFTAPDYPWHGVAGSELIHATFDPERARRWQQDASLNERANATLARFAKEGGPAPSLSHWAKWVAVWVSQEPEPRPYVTLTPSANVLARSIQQRPGTLWQRIREQFHWSSETVDDAHLLVQRIASGIRDVPFSTFYEWARIARWHEQHAHEPNGGSSFPNAWTDALAQQCIHDEDFWDKFPNADALVALDEWLTTNPLSTSPTLDKLLADYTHWLALQPSSHDPATYVPKVPAAEKEALKQAWVQEYEARPAVGRDLAWLARTRNLVPSLGQGADPLTFRSRMMTWLTTLVDEGEIVAHETDEAPWDTHYTLSSHTLSEIQSRRQEVTTDTKPLPTIDPQWSHLIDLWTTTFGSGLATLDRVLSLITNDSTLSKLLPRNPKNQRKFLRETLFPHLPPQDPPVIIERHYNRNTRHTFYRLVSAPFSEPHSPSIPSKPRPERSLEDSPGSSEFSMSEIEEFFAGWYRSFGERSVKIGQLMRKGQEQGWILPLATENHRNPNKPHPLTTWLMNHINRPITGYQIAKRSGGYALTTAFTDKPASSQDTASSIPKTHLTADITPRTEHPADSAPVLETSEKLSLAQAIENLKPTDSLSVYWAALAPWVPLLEDLGPQWFLEWPLDGAVCNRIMRLWPVLTRSLTMGTTNAG